MILLTISTAVVLLTSIDVGSWGYSISISVWCIVMHFKAVMNNNTSSASTTKDIMYFMILAIVMTTLLNISFSIALDRQIWALAQFFVLVLLR